MGSIYDFLGTDAPAGGDLSSLFAFLTRAGMPAAQASLNQAPALGGVPPTLGNLNNDSIAALGQLPQGGGTPGAGPAPSIWDGVRSASSAADLGITPRAASLPPPLDISPSAYGAPQPSPGMAQAPSAPPQAQPGPSWADRLRGIGNALQMAGIGASPGGAMQLLQFQQGQRAIQAKYTAYLGALTQQGMAPQQAHTYALAAATSPEAEKQISQMIGPRMAPTAIPIKTNGAENTALWDPRAGTFMQPGSVPTLAPTNQSASSMFSATPAPPNVDAAEWNKKQAEDLSAQRNDLQTYARDAIKNLPDIVRTQQKVVNTAGQNVIGPIAGSWPYTTFRNVMANAPIVGPGYANERDTAGEVGADLKRLGIVGMKSAFGGRVTQNEWAAYQKITGDLSSASPNVVANNLGTRARNLAEGIDLAIKEGVINPNEVPPEVMRLVEQQRAMPKMAPGSIGPTVKPGNYSWSPTGGLAAQ